MTDEARLALEEILNTTTEERQNPAIWFKRVDAARAALRSVRSLTPQEPDPYREAIDEAMVVRHLGIANGNPVKELNTILSWEVAVALDPKVSKDAQALIDKGKSVSPPLGTREALEKARVTINAVAEFMRKDVQSGNSDLWSPEYEALHDDVIICRHEIDAALIPATGGENG